jgi:hypothetical protein
MTLVVAQLSVELEMAGKKAWASFYAYWPSDVSRVARKRVAKKMMNAGECSSGCSTDEMEKVVV